MKKIIFIIFVVAAFNLVAQDYEYTPFATENAQWSVGDEKYALHGDTVIDGVRYSKVYKQTSDSAFEFDVNKAEYFCAIRNDDGNKRVYGIYRDSLSVINAIGVKIEFPTKEMLLYDFSLKIGDTVSVVNFDEADVAGYISYVDFVRVEVLSVYIYDGNGSYDLLHLYDNDSIVTLENGEQRRRMLLESADGSVAQYWIEGIGSNEGPFVHDMYDFLEYSPKRLLCYKENDDYMYYQDEFDIDGEKDCFTNYHPSDVPENCMNDDIKVYPNPATSSVEISYVLPEKEKTATFVLTNTLGVNVLTTELEGNNGVETINLGNIPSGIYFYTVRSGDDAMTGKLVVE